MKLPLLIAAGIGLFISGCYRDTRHSDNVQMQAYVPVYAQPADINNITITGVQSTQIAGKIYALGNYIYQNDVNKGIHIIDNTDKAHPQKIAFLQIPFNTDFAVRDHYVYANNMNDLVVVDINNLLHPLVVKRIENAFPYPNQEYPPGTGYFVCPDPSKGFVVEWKLETVQSPACRR